MNPKLSSMLTLLSACCAGLAFALPAQAEGYGFKGVTLGSHIGLVANDPKYDCRYVTTPTADRVCGLRKDETETMAGARVDSVFYYYDQSALTGIVIHLPEEQFQSVVAALTTKYGNAARSTETLRNLKGRPFENHIYRWHQPGQSIVAQRYSGRLDRASVRIADDLAAGRIKERRERLAREPQQDL